MKNGFSHTIIQSFSIVFFSMTLVGCKIELYSGLSEKEGNEMLAILLDSGISPEKLQDKDKNVTLKVKVDDVSKAIRLLQNFGYPKDKFSSIGDIFPKDGLISSPTEEKARYTYSMSQELSSTLSMIDGVIAARVHVVLPQEQDSLTEVVYPSSASVFIKYTSELELAGFIPKVKTLVANSIEGLALDKITVSLFPATRISQVNLIATDSASAKSSTRIVAFFLIGLLLVIMAGCGVVAWMVMNNKPIKWLPFLNKSPALQKNGTATLMQVESVDT